MNQGESKAKPVSEELVGAKPTGAWKGQRAHEQFLIRVAGNLAVRGAGGFKINDLSKIVERSFGSKYG